jgi:hypothetical protein
MQNFNNGSFSDTTNQIFLTSGSSSNTTLAILQVMDYSATDKHKTALVRTNAPTIQTLASANRWPNTNAITQMSIQCGASTFNSGTTFNLYGVIA